jgi:hypothetical protein
MLRAVLRLLIPCLSLVISLTALTHQASACSGGGPRIQLDTVILEADAVIYGRVIETDDAGQNVIVRVNTHLNGKAGPRNILVSLWSAPGVILSRDRRFSGGCSAVGASLSINDNIIMFLNRNEDGSYSRALGLFGASLDSTGSYARFPARDTRISISYYEESASVAPLYRQLTRDELVGLIFSVPGAYPAKPIDDTPYPLEAPLLLIDDVGRHYLLPIDGGTPVELVDDEKKWLRRYRFACWTEDCTAWSHIGLDSIYAAQYGSTNDWNIRGIIFSPAGDTYAYWQQSEGNTTLLIGSTIVNTTWFYADPAQWPGNTKLEVIYDGLLATRVDLGAWSPDGRLLAFVDDRGLWLWDPFTPDAKPELQPQEDVTAVHGFSRTGRYLSVTVSGERKHLDLVSGEYLPDGAFSPEDRTLVVYGNPPRLIHFVPRSEFPFPAEIYGTASLLSAEWTGRWRFAALMCGDETRESCAIIELSRDKLREPAVHTGYAFDYSQDTESLVVVQDSNVLSIRNGLNNEMQEVDLSGVIGGEIIDVEWLPSLFYYEAHEGGLP